MSIVVYKNDFSGLIKTPLIMVATDENNTVESIIESISPTLNPIVVNSEDLPDQKYTKAWIITGDTVSVDMPVARDILRERIRRARVNKFTTLDIQFQRALETGASTAEIVANKEMLRNATNNPEIENATTTKQLNDILTQFEALEF